MSTSTDPAGLPWQTPILRQLDAEAGSAANASDASKFVDSTISYVPQGYAS